jgi:hypothetical protein
MDLITRGIAVAVFAVMLSCSTSGDRAMRPTEETSPPVAEQTASLAAESDYGAAEESPSSTIDEQASGLAEYAEHEEGHGPGGLCADLCINQVEGIEEQWLDILEIMGETDFNVRVECKTVHVRDGNGKTILKMRLRDNCDLEAY